MRIISKGTSEPDHRVAWLLNINCNFDAMMNPLPLLLIGFLLCQCKNSENDIATALPEVPAAPDTVLYQVRVNNLRMRSEPNLTSSTVTMLPEDAVVQYWGEHSTEQITINLRGRDITDHWYLVKLGNNRGWIFGGGVTEMKEKSAFDHLIVPGHRVGPVKADDSETSIIERLGDDQVERGEFILGEGEAVEATFLFPSTENELILLWELQDFSKLREIRIRKAQSKWKLANGIGIGSTLKEVNRANGGPFLMTGFNWEYAGTTLNWQGGSLPEGMTLVFAPPVKIHKSLVGDQSISSEDERMARANPKVRTIRILF